jgi:hypothetical protein
MPRDSFSIFSTYDPELRGIREDEYDAENLIITIYTL